MPALTTEQFLARLKQKGLLPRDLLAEVTDRARAENAPPRNIVRWLRAKQFAGVIGMEHGNSIQGRAGEDRLVAAYREIDAA